MNTNFNELKEQMTLAPIETKLQEYYTPQNLTQRDSNLLAMISKSSISAIETAIGSLNHLVSNLKIYKECMIDSINLQAESADIAIKYANEPQKQVNVLPGVITTPQTYDLNNIRSDNERMMQIKDQKDKVLDQKNIYLRLSKEDVRLFMSSWKRLNLSDASFNEFIESIGKTINPTYGSKQ